MAAVRKTPTRAASARGDETRDDFLDIAGHELRTPITALKGHVQLLERRLRKQGEREQDLAELSKMLYQLERLNHQLDVYLAASHLARDKFAILPAEADLTAIIHRLLDTYKTGTTGRRFSLVAPDEPVVGIWDRRRAEQAYSALLANAVKYSPEASEIETRIRIEQGGVRIEVSDRGPGVPPPERHRIFEAYVHGGNVENSGPGLGLFVAREAVRRQGGRIGVRARPGGGSIFWCWLPLVVTTRRHPVSATARTRAE